MDGIMPDEKDTTISLIVSAAIFFLLGFILSTIIAYVAPPILDVGETIFPNSDIQSIAWFFIIILMVMVLMVMPSVYIYEALMGAREWENSNSVVNIFIAIMIFLVGLLITYKGWFIIEGLPQALLGIPDAQLQAFLTAIYWVSVVITWLEIIIISPIWIIIKSLELQE